MTFEVRSGGPRPWFTVLVIAAIASLVIFSVSRTGYFWVMLAPNLLLLFMTLVMIVVFFEEKMPARKPLKKYPLVSVVFPVHNAADSIARAVECARKSVYPGEIELIAVDDASTDSSPSVLAGLKGVRVLTMKKNVGKAAALNRGAKIARGSVVVFVDADSYLTPHALRHAVEALYSADDVGAATCFIQVHEPKNLLQKLQQIEYYTGFGFSAISSYLLDAIFVTPGPTTVFKKKVFDELGGFDEQNITEDLEMAWRLRRKGYKIAYSRDAVVFTDVPSKLNDLYRQRLRWYRGKLYNIRKYKDMLFNPAYGNFGVFMLPFSFTAEISGVVLSFSFAYLALRQALWLAAYLASALALNHFSLDVSGFSLFGVSAIVMGFVIAAPWIFALYLSYLVARQKFKWTTLPYLVLFLFFYGFVVSFFYCASFLKEVNRSDYKWK
ncbi:MAG: glycosyltransferase [Candidatus Micrarchaeia archaeon]